MRRGGGSSYDVGQAVLLDVEDCEAAVVGCVDEGCVGTFNTGYCSAGGSSGGACRWSQMASNSFVMAFQSSFH